MALGDTTVEVIIKNISNRNMMSVIDAILKFGDIFVLLFNAMANYFCAGSLSKSMKASVLASILFTTPSTKVTR